MSLFTLCYDPKYTRGFQMTFENGWNISIQFGHMNCCANQNYAIPSGVESADYYHLKSMECVDAEIALIDPDGMLDFNPEWCDQVKARVPADEVLRWMMECQAKPADSRARVRSDFSYDDDEDENIDDRDLLSEN